MLTITVALPAFAGAGSWTLLLETDADAPSGQEVYRATYESIAKFLSDDSAAEGFTNIGLSETWGIGGLASDFDQYHLILESDDDSPGGQEVFRVTYDSLADFVADIPAAQGFSNVDVGSSWRIGGFASDGDQYHLILESNADQPGGAEIFQVTYDSLADFVADFPAATAFSAVDIGPDQSVGGFASDGDQYHLILESNSDAPAGGEVFRITYDSNADFLSDTQAASGFSDLDVDPAQGVAGFSGQVPIFEDGFESGDFSAWSATTP